jgi:hypothetical protein
VATYKVIQDIEAEDKLVGPLSFRQFIYGLITAFCIYLSVVCLTHHVAFLAIIFLPPGLFTGFLAFPFGKDQPTEVWALAKLRFLIKPHRRIWNQSGVKEVVTVTVPKKIEVVRTNGLDPIEVRSRLRALADTIDSRGWAIKNVNVNLYDQAAQQAADDSDRLISIANLPQEVPNYDVQASDDMLDEYNNPLAQQMDQMISASTTAHRKQIIQTLNAPVAPAPLPQQPLKQNSVAPGSPPADYWFLQGAPAQPQTASQAAFTQSLLVAPHNPADDEVSAPMTPDEQAILNQIKSQTNIPQTSFAHLRTIQPISNQAAQSTSQPAMPQPAPAISYAPINTTPTVDYNTLQQPMPVPVTPTPDPAILTLANNNDLNVATIAREAQKTKELEESSQDEVVISLH